MSKVTFEERWNETTIQSDINNRHAIITEEIEGRFEVSLRFDAETILNTKVFKTKKGAFNTANRFVDNIGN